MLYALRALIFPWFVLEGFFFFFEWNHVCGILLQISITEHPLQLLNLELLNGTPEKFYLPSTKAAEIIHRVPVK